MLFSGGILCSLHTVFANDSSLDTSFGNNGFVTTSIGTSSDIDNSVVQQDDGKILVSGYSFNFNGTDYNFAVARDNFDGSLDNTFSGDGIATKIITGRMKVTQ